jgi:hypothetical protein
MGDLRRINVKKLCEARVNRRVPNQETTHIHSLDELDTFTSARVRHHHRRVRRDLRPGLLDHGLRLPRRPHVRP